MFFIYSLCVIQIKISSTQQNFTVKLTRQHMRIGACEIYVHTFSASTTPTSSHLTVRFFFLIPAATVTPRRPPLVRPMQTAVTGSSTRRSSSPQTPYTLPCNSPRPRRHTASPASRTRASAPAGSATPRSFPEPSAPQPAANASGIRITSFQLIEEKRSFLICNLIKTRNLPSFNPSSDAAYRKCM